MAKLEPLDNSQSSSELKSKKKQYASQDSSDSVGSAASSVVSNKPLPPPILVYHESARSIVFRDHLRRQATNVSDMTVSSPASIRAPSRSSSLNGNFDAGSRPATRPVTPIPEDETKAGHTSQARRGSESSASTVESVSSMKQKIGNPSPSRKHSHSRPSTPVHGDARPQVIIANFTPVIKPLPRLELSPSDEFAPLLLSDPYLPFVVEKPDPVINLSVWDSMSLAEKEVVQLLESQHAVVKTVKNADWTAFFGKFSAKAGGAGSHGDHLSDMAQHRILKHAKENEGLEEHFLFNSFVTSTSLLPPCGRKMRCFGSLKEYNTGVLFALPIAFPNDAESEDSAAKRTKMWSWPSGYSAKTEFNIDERGNLINGREEAIVPLSGLRKMNHTYLYDTDYEIVGRMVRGGLKTLPYNEVFVRVGGLGRIVNGVDISTGKSQIDGNGTGRSFENGIGLPIALFVRSPSYGDLIAMLRIRARMSSVLGRDHVHGIPLLYLHPDMGVRVLTDKLQKDLLHIMSSNLNPFQNPLLQYKTTIDNTSESHMQQKLEELIDLDDDDIREMLTPEECARLAGGFGATDDSVAHLLMDAMLRDNQREIEIGDDRNTFGDIASGGAHSLQDIVNEGLSAAVRSGDYNTSRQLLILYTLVACRGQQDRARAILNSDKVKKIEQAENGLSANTSDSGDEARSSNKKGNALAGATGINANVTPFKTKPSDVDKSKTLVKSGREENTSLSAHIPPPPPPPPLDTDRLRSATNSDGLLAVLGAAEVLKSMQDSSAKRRVEEAVLAIEEWVENGESSVAFRLASWRDQRAAQGDLKIATKRDSNFMAFISNKAISNRKLFAKQLREAIFVTDFESIEFLKSIYSIVSKMHSPCLRLELLQYILGLDNRYSIAHVGRSVELAATCLNISAHEAMQRELTM